MTLWQMSVELSNAIDCLHAATARLRQIAGLEPDERRMLACRLATLRGEIESLQGLIDCTHAVVNGGKSND